MTVRRDIRLRERKSRAPGKPQDGRAQYARKEKRCMFHRTSNQLAMNN
jgi:hypothetical protein